MIELSDHRPRPYKHLIPQLIQVLLLFLQRSRSSGASKRNSVANKIAQRNQSKSLHRSIQKNIIDYFVHQKKNSTEKYKKTAINECE